MADLDALIKAHLSVWATADSAARAAQIAKVYTEDVSFVEPGGVASGRKELSAGIGRLHEAIPGLGFSVSSPVQRSQDWVMYQWTQPTPAGAPDVIGWDVLHVDGDLIDRGMVFISS